MAHLAKSRTRKNLCDDQPLSYAFYPGTRDGDRWSFTLQGPIKPAGGTERRTFFYLMFTETELRNFLQFREAQLAEQARLDNKREPRS